MEKIISVIIPTYKPGSYIFENLDKLRSQTLDHAMFEVIIVLNGPREPFYSQIDAYVSQCKDMNVRLIYSEKKGVSDARSTGIDESKGHYLVFIDDDDWVSPNYLEGLLSHKDGNSLVLANVKLIDDTTGQQLVYYTTKVYQRLKDKPAPSIFEARSYLSAVWGKLIPRQVIGDDRFPSNYVLGQDALFMFDISWRITGFGLASEDTVYHVRYRTDSASHKHRSYWQRCRIAMRVFMKYVKIYSSEPGKYSFPFFLSRLVATLRKLLQRSYEVEARPM